MSKKIIGFLIPIIGTILILKYLTKGSKKNTQINRASSSNKIKGEKRVVNMNKLNERQQKILKLFKKRSVLLPVDIYAIAPDLSTRTLRRDMNKLVELGFVIQKGSTKDTKYILKNNYEI